jgi:hypothetical protein
MRRQSTLIVLLLALLLIPVQASLQAQTPNTPHVRLKSTTFDPAQGEPNLPASLRTTGAADRADTYLIQLNGPITEQAKEQLTKAGARLYGYVPDYTLLARLDGKTAQAIQGLGEVRWVGLYHPAYRLAPAATNLAASNTAPLQLSIQTLPELDLKPLADTLRGWGATIQAQTSTKWQGYLRVTLTPDRLTDLANQDGVLWVEPYFEPQLFNDVGGSSIMRITQVRQDLGLYGAGQIVAVADSGLDMGTTGAAMSDDFEGRIVQGVAMCDLFPNTRTTWDDLHGHGTHVSGSVLGDGRLSGSNPATHSYGNSFAGAAPEARLYFQAIDSDGDGGLECIPEPADREQHLYGPPYTAGARIHTNSWGGPSGDNSNPYGGYNAGAQSADQAMWTHKDLLILYAAGNSGEDADSNGVIDPDTIGSPGTAKNILTVGASENNRPDITYDWTAFGYNSSPFSSDRIANNARGMAAFSSRGPTDDGRIKPDLAAPGTRIISARTHVSSAQTDSYDANYAYSDGTSMATPLTAGAAALVREWLTRIKQVTTPSAALIKALLLNGTADMSPGQYGTGSTREIPATRPNNVSGWGRVDMVQTINPPTPRQIWFQDNTTGLATGGTVEYELSVGVPGLRAANAAPFTLSTSAPKQTLTLKQPGTPAAPVTEGDSSVAGTTQLLQNPGFEGGTFTPWETHNNTSLDTAIKHGGDSSAHLAGGNSANDQVYQLVTIPADASDVTVSFWGKITTSETWASSDFLAYGFYDQATGNAILERSIDIGTNGTTDWQQVTDSLTEEERALVQGQTVYLAFILTSDFWLGSEAWVDDTALNVTTGSTSTDNPFRVTLSWTDYPGELAAAKALVNDLDLEIVAPNGTRYPGNQGLYTGSSFNCTRDNQWDSCNTNETVLIPQAAPGTYRVIVRGYQVPQGTQQPFALAAYGDHLRPATDTPTCYDFNNSDSGRVGVDDIQAVAMRFLNQAVYDARYDTNNDSTIDLTDIQTVAGKWGQSC